MNGKTLVWSLVFGIFASPYERLTVQYASTMLILIQRLVLFLLFGWIEREREGERERERAYDLRLASVDTMIVCIYESTTIRR